MRWEHLVKIVVIRCLLFIEFLKLPFVLLSEVARWVFLPAKKKDVSKDIVLITGGAQGIGREIAFGYGRLGATVVCVDVNCKANEDTVADLTKEGIEAYGYICDITKKENVEKLARTVAKEVGDVSIVVNNAGVLAAKPVDKLSEQQIRLMFEVNIIAQFWVIQEFLPGMVKRDRGHIVAVSSTVGLAGTEYLSAYSATKWAIRGLMACVAKELDLTKSKVKLTTVFPYYTRTNLLANEKPIVGRLWLMSPRSIARELINAQRTDTEDISVPKFLYDAVNMGNVMPRALKKSGERIIGYGAGFSLSDSIVNQN